MEKERKILPVVSKFSSFKDAEKADDEYWQNTTAEERLAALIDLRKVFINNPAKKTKLQKVVIKRSVYEEAG